MATAGSYQVRGVGESHAPRTSTARIRSSPSGRSGAASRSSPSSPCMDSAWKNGNGKGREFDAARARLLEGARQGEYQVVVVVGPGPDVPPRLRGTCRALIGRLRRATARSSGRGRSQWLPGRSARSARSSCTCSRGWRRWNPSGGPSGQGRPGQEESRGREGRRRPRSERGGDRKPRRREGYQAARWRTGRGPAGAAEAAAHQAQGPGTS